MPSENVDTKFVNETIKKESSVAKYLPAFSLGLCSPVMVEIEKALMLPVSFCIYTLLLLITKLKITWHLKNNYWKYYYRHYLKKIDYFQCTHMYWPRSSIRTFRITSVHVLKSLWVTDRRSLFVMTCSWMAKIAFASAFIHATYTAARHWIQIPHIIFR